MISEPGWVINTRSKTDTKFRCKFKKFLYNTEPTLNNSMQACKLSLPNYKPWASSKHNFLFSKCHSLRSRWSLTTDLTHIPKILIIPPLLGCNQISLKLHFPKFNWKYSNSWIYKCKQYFEFKGVDPQQQAQLASFPFGQCCTSMASVVKQTQKATHMGRIYTSCASSVWSDRIWRSFQSSTLLKQTFNIKVYQKAWEAFAPGRWHSWNFSYQMLHWWPSGWHLFRC